MNDYLSNHREKYDLLFVGQLTFKEYRGENAR